jgi:glycosyltransferase involved in cell wall biosynthesis
MKKRILVVGADLSNNGGIASVVKTLYKVENKGYEYDLLKTYYYKDKSAFFELMILIKAIIIYQFKLLSFKYPIIHIHSSMNVSFFRKSIFLLEAKLFRRKTIIHIHSSAFDDFFINSTGFKKKYIKFILSLPDKIFVLCNDWKNKIEATHQLTSDVIYNPITLKTPYSYKAKPQVLNILFLGFFIPTKGIEDLMTITKHFKNTDKVKFTIGGKGDMEDFIKDFIKTNELTNVDLVGWVGDVQKKKFLDELDVLILPSYKEGMPISILEAISNSMPIISTNIAGTPELVYTGQNGFLCKPGEIECFIKAIEFFINAGDETFNQFRKKSRDIANNFSDELIVKQIEEIYTSLLT